MCQQTVMAACAVSDDKEREGGREGGRERERERREGERERERERGWISGRE